MRLRVQSKLDQPHDSIVFASTRCPKQRVLSKISITLRNLIFSALGACACMPINVFATPSLSAPKQEKKISEINETEEKISKNLAEILMLLEAVVFIIVGILLFLKSKKHEWEKISQHGIAIARAKSEKDAISRKATEYLGLATERQVELERLKALTDVNLLEQLREQLLAAQTRVQELTMQINASYAEWLFERNRLASVISALTEEIGNLRKYRDATVLAEAAALTDGIEQLVGNFRVCLQTMLTVDGTNEKGPRLIFAVNPDLTTLLEEARFNLGGITSTWLNDNLPADERSHNERFILPLVQDFIEIEHALSHASFRVTFERLLKLLGKIEMLTKLNDGTSEPETKSQDPKKDWEEYKISARIDTTWLDSQGMLINFFEVLGIAEATVWSKDLNDRARAGMRRAATTEHPDVTENENGFREVSTAKRIFSNEYETTLYLSMLKKFRSLFNH